MGGVNVFLCLAVLVNGAQLHPARDLTDILQRLDHLENKVESLTNEVTRLKHARNQNCNPAPATSSDNSDVSTVEGPPGVELRVLEARREKVPDGVMFTVRYWTNGQHPVVANWTEEPEAFETEGKKLIEVTNDPKHSASPGIRETRVIAEVDNDRKIHLELRAYSSSMFLSLNAGESDQIFEIKPPEVHVTPLGDIVYTPGQDAEIKVEYPREEPESYYSYNYKQFILVDPKDRHDIIVADEEPFDDFVVNSNSTELLESTENALTFRTSKYPTRGILVLGSGKYYNDGHKLLNFITTHSAKTIRASNETGPFPPGLLATSLVGSGRYVNGTFQAKCPEKTGAEAYTYTLYHDCHVVCYGVGMGIERVTIRRHFPSGRSDIIKSGTRNIYGSFNVVNIIPYSKEPDQVRYSCEAIDNTGRSIKENFEVNFFVETRIVDKESYAVWLNDTTIEFKCVFRANEQPENITWSYDLGDGGTSFDTNNIESSGKYKFTSITHVNVDLRERLRFGSLGTQHASCKVKCKFDDHYAYDKFTLQSSDLFQSATNQ